MHYYYFQCHFIREHTRLNDTALLDIRAGFDWNVILVLSVSSHNVFCLKPCGTTRIGKHKQKILPTYWKQYFRKFTAIFTELKSFEIVAVKMLFYHTVQIARGNICTQDIWKQSAHKYCHINVNYYLFIVLINVYR